MANVYPLVRRLPLSLSYGRTLQVGLERFTDSAAGSNSGSSSTESSKASPTQAEEYKVPEYFAYNPDSYYNFENVLVKYRLEQPVPGVKY